MVETWVALLAGAAVTAVVRYTLPDTPWRQGVFWGVILLLSAGLAISPWKNDAWVQGVAWPLATGAACMFIVLDWATKRWGKFIGKRDE